MTFSPAQEFDREAFSALSSLDEAQEDAVLYALSNDLTLIQGPPGTGKSYTSVAIIKTLLKNRSAAELGPIICVCYTNHALDQLLGHLVKGGVKQIVRIGSRSKSLVCGMPTSMIWLTKKSIQRRPRRQIATKVTRRLMMRSKASEKSCQKSMVPPPTKASGNIWKQIGYITLSSSLV